MTTILLTTTGAGTWTVPVDCPAGAQVTVETWGAGSGASGRVSTNYGAGGGGGAYASSAYVVTPNDTSAGVPYVIGTGSAGASGANPSNGGATSWSNNNINVFANSINNGIAVGTPGTLPTGATTYNPGSISLQVIGFGTENGLPYYDIRYFGTTTSTNYCSLYLGALTPAAASTAYTFSLSHALVGGSTTGTTNIAFTVDTNTAVGYDNNITWTALTPTSTLTPFATTATTTATTVFVNPYIIVYYDTGVSLDLTLRIAGIQIESGSTQTYFKSTPGYTQAAGGSAPVTTTGGAGGTTAASVGTTLFAGGAGAAYNSSGSGGGGAAGKNGAGQVGTTAGVGGHGDGTSIGGTGGAVKTTSPGNPGTSNVEGGGGGGGLKTVAGTGGAGGAPGGGGGGAAVATGTGGSGARGQIRLTYISQFIAGVNYQPAAPIQIWDH